MKLVASSILLSTILMGHAALAAERDVYVCSVTQSVVERLDGSTGADLGAFASGGGLSSPLGVQFGPDGNLYVASDGTDQVLRYDGQTGAFLNVFGSFSHNFGVTGITFGPDGDIYATGFQSGTVERLDGTTGANKGVFASGGLSMPYKLRFGPDGNLYVCSSGTNEVWKFNGQTGAVLGVWTTTNAYLPRSLEWGPDGNLWVGGYSSANVVRLDGHTGAYLGTFISDARLTRVAGITFGSDMNVYLTNVNAGEVDEFEGATGAWIRTFAPVRFPNDLTSGQAPSIPPTAFHVLRGRQESGNLASLLTRDGDYLIVRNGLTLNRAESPITVAFEGTSRRSTANSLSFTTIMKASITGLIQRIDLYDFSLGRYVQYDARAASQNATSTTVLAWIPAHYIESGTAAVKAQVRIAPAGPTFVNTWRMLFDEVYWRAS